jgi:hypothetical protein
LLLRKMQKPEVERRVLRQPAQSSIRVGGDLVDRASAQVKPNGERAHHVSQDVLDQR